MFATYWSKHTNQKYQNKTWRQTDPSLLHRRHQFLQLFWASRVGEGGHRKDFDGKASVELPGGGRWCFERRGAKGKNYSRNSRKPWKTTSFLGKSLIFLGKNMKKLQKKMAMVGLKMTLEMRKPSYCFKRLFWRSGGFHPFPHGKLFGFRLASCLKTWGVGSMLSLPNKSWVIYEQTHQAHVEPKQIQQKLGWNIPKSKNKPTIKHTQTKTSWTMPSCNSCSSLFILDASSLKARRPGRARQKRITWGVYSETSSSSPQLEGSAHETVDWVHWVHL